MASTRETLDHYETRIEESMGVRPRSLPPALSPQADPRDRNRRPIRNFGKVTIDQVVPDPNQPRLLIDEEPLQRLADSIRVNGQLSPIRVRWSETHQKWMIIAGERRWRATQRAGLPMIDCYFHDNELTPTEILEQSLIENCLREDLQPLEEAKAFAQLMKLNTWNGKQLAAAIHVGPAKVSRALALLDLPAEVQLQVQNGELSARAGYQISTLDNQAAQERLAIAATTGKLTSAAIAKAARQRRGSPKRRMQTSRCIFSCEGGWKIVVTANKRGSYDEIEHAFLQALEEVRHYIRCGRRLF